MSIPTSKVHLAIFSEPFLTLVLNGKKKVDSRFSKNRIAPYGKVVKNDLVLIKRSGGKIIGSFIVQKVRFVEIKNKIILEELKKKYSRLICADVNPDFWKKRVSAKYATFIWIGEISHKNPIVRSAPGRSGWRVLK